MYKLIKIFAAGVLALAITIPAIAQNGKSYGKKFKTREAFAATELSRRMGDKPNMDDVVISGEITEVCQAMGCWLKLKNEAGEDVFVKIKDHAFLMPKDIAGRKAYVYGNVVKKTVSVDELRHYAEDAGKSTDEIAKITEGKTELRVVAKGIAIE